MTFKDIAAEDIQNVFFNFDEFADDHVINGYTMSAIIDENSLDAHPKGDDIAGLFAEITSIYVQADEYGAPPKKGAIITIDDDRNCRVVDTVQEAGVYQIRVERWRSNADIKRRY